MKVFRFDQNDSVIQEYISELRDVSIQKDPLRFRTNIRRIGHLMAYEISKTITYKNAEVDTPLAKSSARKISDQLVISTLFRAGLPMHEGFLDVFDHAENGFVSAFRKYNDDHTSFEVEIEYLASPDLTNKTLIIVDPMLATGSSMELAFEAMKKNGVPGRLVLAGIIASEPAIETLQEKFDDSVSLYIAAIDSKLDNHSYIVPGLGDAGDLSYGEKL